MSRASKRCSSITTQPSQTIPVETISLTYSNPYDARAGAAFESEEGTLPNLNLA